MPSFRGDGVPAWPTAAGLAGGLVLDAVLADPRRAHPVAAFGMIAAKAEQATYRDSRAVGVLYAGALVTAAGLVGSGLGRSRRAPVARLAVTAAGTWVVVGGTSLRREAVTMHRLLASADAHADPGAEADLTPARARLSHLCGRDATNLDRDGLARATVESVAENTSDAVVGPLFWGAVAGLPGLLGYRAINTLDAMVGHRSERYLRFGWAAARLDDLANLVPARLTAALAVLLAPIVGGDRHAALRAWRRDGHKHPSPNAGPVEAAFAGALGLTLGGDLAYAGQVEHRPLMGNGPSPRQADIPRANRLSLAVSCVAGALAVSARLAVPRRS